MRVSDLLREHLLEVSGYPHGHRRVPDLPDLRVTEWCDEFDRLRRNRMVMGAHRYGLMCEARKWRTDRIVGLRSKLAFYSSTGNTEALVDIANYAMLEFMRPAHPTAHFRALDDHGTATNQESRKEIT